MFTIDLHLDSESGLVAGRDVGGMPKTHADLNYDFENRCFVVSNENGVVASLAQAINTLHTAAKQMGNAVEQGGDD